MAWGHILKFAALVAIVIMAGVLTSAWTLHVGADTAVAELNRCGVCHAPLLTKIVLLLILGSATLWSFVTGPRAQSESTRRQRLVGTVAGALACIIVTKQAIACDPGCNAGQRQQQISSR
jgi:hypothetical protein